MKGPYLEPLLNTNKPSDSMQLISSSADFEDEEMHQESMEKLITTGRRTKKLTDEEEADADSKKSKRGSPHEPQMLISELSHKRDNKITTVPELELRKLVGGELFFKLYLISGVKYGRCLNSVCFCFFVCLQISIWAASPSFILLRCRSSCCLASAVTLTRTGNHGTKR